MAIVQRNSLFLIGIFLLISLFINPTSIHAVNSPGCDYLLKSKGSNLYEDMKLRFSDHVKNNCNKAETYETCTSKYVYDAQCSSQQDKDAINLDFSSIFVEAYNNLNNVNVTLTPTPTPTLFVSNITPIPMNCKLLSSKIIGIDSAKRRGVCKNYSAPCSDFGIYREDNPDEATVFGCCDNMNSCPVLEGMFTYGRNGEIIPNENIDTTPTKKEDSVDLAKNLAGNCGFDGMQCCDPEIQELLESKPDIFNFDGERFDLFDYAWGVIKEFAVPGAKEIQEQISEVSSGQLLCKGNRAPYFKLSDGTETRGFNDYDTETQSYFGKRDCQALFRNGDPEAGRACNTNPRYTIPRSQIQENEGCTCISADGKFKDDPRTASVAVIPPLSKDEIYLQICGGPNNECLQCLKNGHYYQNFSRKCEVTEESAQSALEEEIKKRLRVSASNQIYAQIQNSQSSNVLGIADSICGEIPDDGSRALCKQCIASGKFWNIAGCTSVALSTENAERLCQNLAGSELGFCTLCVQSGQHWTALGCVSPRIGVLIQDWLFGFGLGLAGVVALGCIIYSAFLMQTSMGDPEKVSKAQELMTSCIVGLIVIIFSVFILRVIGVDILRIPGLTDSAVSTLPGTGTPTSPAISVAPPTAPTPLLTSAPASPPSSSSPTISIPTPTPILVKYACGANPTANEVYLYDNPYHTGPCLRLEVGDYADLSASDIKNNSMFKTSNNFEKIKRCADNFNDCINSMKVGEGVEVTIYSDSNFQGTPSLYNPKSEPTSLDLVGLGDSVSSVKIVSLIPISTPTTLPPAGSVTPIGPTLSITSPVLPTPTVVLAQYTCGVRPGPDEVYLYDNENYENTGPCLRLTIGEYLDLSIASIKNDSMFKTNFNILKVGRCADNFNDCFKSIRVGENVKVTVWADSNKKVPSKSFPSNTEIANLSSQGMGDSISSVVVEKD